MSNSSTVYKPQFIGTRSVLLSLISISWAILLLVLVLAFFSGAAKSLGGSLALALVGGLIGAIVIAVLSSVFVGIICLIDIRNMTAEQHYGISERPPLAPRRKPPQRRIRSDPDIDDDRLPRT